MDMNKYKEVFIKNLRLLLERERYRYVVHNGQVHFRDTITSGLLYLYHGGEMNQFFKDFLNTVVNRGSIFVGDDLSGEMFCVIKINTRNKRPGTKKTKNNS